MAKNKKCVEAQESGKRILTSERDELPAKLTRPRLTKAFQRTRLVEMLEQAFDAPAVWIGAQPGAGKTTLVASWLDAGDRSSLWYQVDAGDADLATFFHHLGLATKHLAPRHKLPLPHLTPEYLLGIETFARRFFEELFRRMPKDSVLVFDDLQDAGADGPLDDILRLAVESLPVHVKMLFVSRVAPPQAFVRLRANGKLAVLESASIRLTVEETKGISALRGYPEEMDVTALHERTHGWVAGLVLMLLGADEKHEFNVESVVDSPETQTLFNYFASEVVRGLDESMQQVLIKSALFSKMRVSDVESLCGDSEAGRVLAELQRQNCFTYRLSPRHPVYEYHPLFREFLLARLEASLTPEALVALKVRAAEHAAAAGSMDEAISLWQAAKTWDAIIPYVCQIAPVLLEQGRGQTLATWIESLPVERRASDPWLQFWFGQCRLPFAPPEARASFERALALFEQHGERTGSLLAWAGLVDTAVHHGQGLDALDAWIEAFERIAGSEPLPPALHDRIVVQMFNALVLRQPAHPDILAWAERSFLVLQSGTDLGQRLIAGVYLCIYFTWMGEPRRARQSLDWLTSLTRGVPLPPLMTQLISATVGMCAWLAEADTPKSLALIDEALASGERTGVHVWQHHLLCEGAAAALSAGDAATARRLLRRFGEGLAHARLTDAAYYHFLCNWEALGCGDLCAAESHLIAAAGLRERIGLTFGNVLHDLMQARTCIARGRFEVARPALDAVHALAAATGSRLIEYIVCIDEALLALHQGDETALRHWLALAFGLGRGHGLVTFHGWQAEPMARLCAFALETGIEREYVVSLIGRRALMPPPLAAPPEAWPWPLKIYTLGKFELISNGKPMVFSGKVQQKPLALLKALIALGGKEVTEEQFADILWPEADGDLAHKSFEMTVQRLRRLVGDHKLFQLQERRLSLDPSLCWIDVWALCDLLEKVDAAWKNGLPSAELPTEVLRLSEKALNLYSGHFLPGDSANAWVLTCRERLRSKFIRLITKLGCYWEEHQQWQAAIEVFQKGLEVDGLTEEFYRHLMICHLEMGQRAEALAVYNRCRTLLLSSLGIPPSQKVEELHQSIIARH